MACQILYALAIGGQALTWFAILSSCKSFPSLLPPRFDLSPFGPLVPCAELIPGIPLGWMGFHWATLFIRLDLSALLRLSLFCLHLFSFLADPTEWLASSLLGIC